jgi:hypothetical protein
VTAQINILNKVASVVASDSAASFISTSKVINSADKIFSLGHSIPVALLINSSAAFCDVPWEKIMGIYAKEINGIELPTMRDYAVKLIDIIEHTKFLTAYNRHLYFMNGWCAEIVNYLYGEYKKSGADKDKFDAFLNSKAKTWEKNYLIVPGNLLPEIENSIRDYLNQVSFLVQYENAVFVKTFYANLLNLMVALFTKAVSGYAYSQIIVTGFGATEFFPSAYAISVQGIFEGHVRHDIRYTYKIDTYEDKERQQSWILKFAQYEGAALFLEGISPDLSNYFYKNLTVSNNTLLNYILSHSKLNTLSQEDKQKVLSDGSAFIKKIEQEIKRDTASYQYDNYTGPISNMAAYMNIDEMIQLAETLVNLTSLKLQFAINKRETVGGPIDVAVLTKENGFEWANKKSHFIKVGGNNE